MSAAGTLTAETPPVAAPADAGRALLDRQLAILGRLAEAGLEMAVALEAQTKGGAAVEGEIALAYSRVSRAVRMCLLLQTRLIEGPAPAASRKANKALQARIDERKAKTLGVLEMTALAEHGEGETAERIQAECRERLEAEPWEALAEAPVEEVAALLARVCRQVGLDWELYRTHPWVRCALQEIDVEGAFARGEYEVFWHDQNDMPMAADTFETAAVWQEARCKAGKAPGADSS